MKVNSILVFFLATLVATSQATFPPNHSRLPGDIEPEDCTENPAHVLQPRSESDELSGSQQINCLSWRLAVETDNLIKWRTIPDNCIQHVSTYMLCKQHARDCDVVADIAIEYAENATRTGGGKDIWVFDVGDTALSNVPYYSRADVQFGVLPYNSAKFNHWVGEGAAPPVPAVLHLYKRLCELGYKIFFISGLHEYQRGALTSNLKFVGYTTWEKLILKQKDEVRFPSSVFKANKRKELEAVGYRIIGNVGDHWSDITGASAGHRTFKIPNPMYYVG